MRVAFRQMTAGKVARQLVIDLQPSALDEVARLARTAEAVGLELDQCGESESVVAGEEINIAVADASSIADYPPSSSRIRP
jgi:hypothetical protein